MIQFVTQWSVKRLFRYLFHQRLYILCLSHTEMQLFFLFSGDRFLKITYFCSQFSCPNNCSCHTKDQAWRISFSELFCFNPGEKQTHLNVSVNWGNYVEMVICNSEQPIFIWLHYFCSDFSNKFDYDVISVSF